MITPAALPGAMTTPTLHIKTDFAPLANGCHHVVHSEIGGEEVSWNETRKASMETGFTDTTLTCLPLPTPSEGHVTRLPTPISGIAYPWTDSNCLSSDSLRVTGRYSDWPKPLPPPSPSPLPPTQAMHPHQISSSLDRATHERYQAPSPHEDLDDVSCTDDLVDEFSALSTHATESPAAGRQHEYPPTPARSTKDGDQDDSQNDSGTDSIFTVVSPACGQIFRYREIVELGTGSFSRVVLAKCEQEYRDPSMQHAARPITPPSHEKDDTGLVAMKIVNIAAAGGGDAERIRESLKREVKLLKSLRHPSIVRMKAYNLSDVQKKAFLALEYSPGSDLQRFACSSKHLLTPAVVKRIFAELVNALVYLHHNWVVHRDVKLESKAFPKGTPLTASLTFDESQMFFSTSRRKKSSTYPQKMVGQAICGPSSPSRTLGSHVVCHRPLDHTGSAPAVAPKIMPLLRLSWASHMMGAQ